MTAAPWQLVTRADRAAAAIADRHYNRQKPGARQFVPPGRCLVLWAPSAVWVTSWPFPQYVQHAWAGAWVNSLFRNEAPDLYLSSASIRSAVALTRGHWPDTPALGLVTFVDPGKVRPKRDPGRCYIRAGFHRAGHTAGGLVALRLDPADMPDPVAPAPAGLW